MDKQNIKALLGAVFALAVALMTCAGCPPTPPVTSPDQARSDLRAAPPPAGVLGECPSTKDLTPGAVCDGFFTPEGLACARCPSSRGCKASDIQIYCATGPCAADPRCTTQR